VVALVGSRIVVHPLVHLLLINVASHFVNWQLVSIWIESVAHHILPPDGLHS